MSIKRTAHSLYDLWYHLAWSTKYRKEVFTKPRTIQRVKEILRAIANHYDITIQEVEICPNHLHLLASAPPRLAPSQIAQILKSKSTELLFKEFSWLENYYWGGEIWIGGYFVRSVGQGMTKAQIDKYVREQSENI